MKSASRLAASAGPLALALLLGPGAADSHAQFFQRLLRPNRVATAPPPRYAPVAPGYSYPAPAPASGRSYPARSPGQGAANLRTRGRQVPRSIDGEEDTHAYKS